MVHARIEINPRLLNLLMLIGFMGFILMACSSRATRDPEVAEISVSTITNTFTLPTASPFKNTNLNPDEVAHSHTGA